MTDDRFDDMLREHTRGYNEPPPVPREEMWQRIAEARRDGRVHAAPPLRLPARRLSWWLATAAALLIGVAIGRTALQPDVTSPRADSPAGAAVVATGDGVEPARPESGVAQTEPSSESPDVRVAAVPSSEVAALSPEQRTPSRTVPPRTSPPAAESLEGLYRYVAHETLGQAEMLLTVFRSEERLEARERIASWARDVLTSTRLLLDSPAAEDQQLAALLQDLELVLAQIAALGDVNGQDRELIDDAIRQRDVLPRLRTVVPAGQPVAGA